MSAKWLWVIVALCGWFLSLGGCALNKAMESMAMLPDAMRDAAKATAQMMADQGVLDKFASGLEGDLINPGFEITSGLEAVSRLRIIGTTGSVHLEASGTGTQLPKDVRAALIEQLSMPISDEQRTGILQILGWNRVTSEHNPPP